jgi:hypothetical protein
MIYVVATVTLKPNSRESFLAELKHVSAEVRREAGRIPQRRICSVSAKE